MERSVGATTVFKLAIASRFNVTAGDLTSSSLQDLSAEQARLNISDNFPDRSQQCSPPRIACMSALLPKADICSALADVRFGSKADICTAPAHVRFTPESGQVQCTCRCPLWANSGHW